MLTQQRHEIILKLLKEKGSITVTEVRDLLDTSESTVRRDIKALDKEGKLEKVFGGAVEAGQKVTAHEYTVAQKNELNCDAKQKIAEYAASLIEPDDFVFLDAGTTTAHMIDFIRATSAVFVTNAVAHAQRLASRGFKVILVGGELKSSRSCRWKPGNPHDPGVSFHQRLFWNKWRNPKKRLHNPGRQRGRHQKDRHGTVPPVLRPLRRKQI